MARLVMFITLFTLACADPATRRLKKVAALQQSSLRLGGNAAAEPKGTPALSGDMPLKAAEQGFEGKQVEHIDQKTATRDWGKEYGPMGPQPVHEEKPHHKPHHSVSVRTSAGF